MTETRDDLLERLKDFAAELGVLESNVRAAVALRKEQITTEKADAERYRWLRAHAKEIVFPRDNPTSYDPTYEKPEELDAAIDAAIAKTTPLERAFSEEPQAGIVNDALRKLGDPTK